MFTGIIQATGSIRSFAGGHLVVDVPNWPQDWEPLKVGESIAINGCCLTVTSPELPLTFDLSPETISRTSFDASQAGETMNLERALRIGERLGGHIVQGHVDGVSEVVSLTRPQDDLAVLRVRVPADGRRYVVEKGSITLSGVSLTVVSPMDGEFDLHLIPETLRNTNLGGLKPGSKLNTEYDVIAKHVETLLKNR